MAQKFNIKSFGKNIPENVNSRSTNTLIDGMLNSSSRDFKVDFKNVQLIELKKIIPNENNFYTINQDEVDSLADSIKVAGLQQPVVLLDNEDGTYKILTGHKRVLAFRILAMGNPKYETIPAFVYNRSNLNVDLPISEESKEEYLLLITNSEMRNKTDKDLYNEFVSLKKIYTEAKDNGYKLNDRVRSIIAKDMSLSYSTVGRMEFIEKNATESIKEAVADGTLEIHEANKIAHESEERQEEILEEIKTAAQEPVLIPEGLDDDEDVMDEIEEITAESKTVKEKKKKIIDELENETYVVSSSEMDDVASAYDSIIDNFSGAAGLVLTKKEYAKVLSAKEKIIKELDKIKSILDKLDDGYGK